MKERLTLEEMQDVIRKQIEKCNDSIEQFIKGQREDLVAKERAESEFLKKYLPEEISDDELRDLVEKAFSYYENPTKKNTGEIISKVFSLSDGKANRKRIASHVSNKL
jgi:uncharacterized protein YqeY